MSFGSVFVLLFVGIQATFELTCTDTSVDPIQPVGCDTINGDLDLAATNYTQHQLQRFYNPNLKTLIGFNSLKIINGNLNCGVNEVLESFIGLENLTNITGTVRIDNNQKLINVSGLGSLQTIGGDLHISLNHGLFNSVSGFRSLQSIGGSLIMSENYLLSTLSGFNSLQHIGGSLSLVWNENLNNLSPLSSIKSIGGNLHIEANNLDCNSVCTKNLIHYFRNISSDVGMDQCNVENFTCPNNSSNVSDQLNTCIYNQECQICNEIGCNFETIIKRCGDGILDSENGEECDTLINTTVCNYGETACQLCNSSICKNFTSTGSYCGDSENGEECDGNQTNILCFTNCSLMLVPQSTTIPTNTETIDTTSVIGPTFESTFGTESNVVESTSVYGSNSVPTVPTKMSDTKVFDTNGFDCDLYSCKISENEDIKIFTVEQLDANSNLVILNNQKLIVSYGNLTLNGFNLSLSSTSVIKIETGCLDAQNSTLNLDLTDVEITPKQKELELIQYECITNKFKKLATASNSGLCLAVEEVYGASHYSVLISQDSYCVSDSFRFTIYQSFYLIMFVLMIVC